MKLSPLARKLAEPAMLVNVPRLVTAYYAERPDPVIAVQRVAFGTSGHRGSAFDAAFREIGWPTPGSRPTARRHMRWRHWSVCGIDSTSRSPMTPTAAGEERAVPQLRARAAYAKQAIRDKLLERTQYITEHGEGLPEVRHLKWGDED
jgi:hypothetical protein